MTIDAPAANPRAARLVVLSGLPGVGKTTVAALLAARTEAVHLSIDAVEDALLGCGLPAGWQVGVAAYEAVRVMAEMNLRAGRDVVVDAVNDSEAARETWRTAARATGADLAVFCLVVADPGEHERRLRERAPRFVHVGEPDWDAVQRRAAEYAPWAEPVTLVDVDARTPEEVVAELRRRI